MCSAPVLAESGYPVSVQSEGIESRLSNGHWECFCVCQEGKTMGGASAFACLPGKCDTDTEGSSCAFEQDGQSHAGELEGCDNMFIIEKPGPFEGTVSMDVG